MKTEVRGGYLLDIDEMSGAFAIYRGAALILRHMPCGEVRQPIRIDGNRVIASFADASLTLELGDSAISVRWARQAVISTIALDGYWYGQGELINQQWPLNRIMLQEDEFSTS